MSNRSSKTLIVTTACGTCIGLLLAAPFLPVIGRCFLSVPIMEKVWVILEMPASWLGDIWTYQLKLPPHGEIGAWMIVPAVVTILLWTLLGFLIGLWRYFKQRKGKGVSQ